MILYLDASVLVSLFILDGSSQTAQRLAGTADMDFAISDFACLEFASAIAKRFRMKLLTRTTAHDSLAAFDAWTARTMSRVETTPADVTAAAAIVRRLDTPLRTGDALHIAIADRIGATIATFDRTMAEAARTLGVEVVPTA